MEDPSTANDQKVLADLKKCMKDANRDPNGMAACQTTFEHEGGTSEADGGKVFTSLNGGKVFVTDGGKVFTITE